MLSVVVFAAETNECDLKGYYTFELNLLKSPGVMHYHSGKPRNPYLRNAGQLREISAVLDCQFCGIYDRLPGFIIGDRV